MTQTGDRELRIDDTAPAGDYLEIMQADSVSVADDPLRASQAAQGLIYRGRLDEAAELLSRFGRSIDQRLNLKDAGELGLARAELAYWRGLYEESASNAESVLGIFRLIEDAAGEGRALYLLGRIARRKGDFDLANREFDRSRTILEALPRNQSRFLLGCVHYNLGVIRQQLGEIEEAERFLTAALEELKSSENGRFYAIALNSYGVLLKTKGAYPEAIQTYQQAIQLLNRHASFDDLAHALNNLAFVQILTGHGDQAARNLSESLELRRRAGDIAGEAGTLDLIGRLHLSRGEYAEAEQAFRSSIDTAELAQNDHEKAVALIGLGMLLNKSGRAEAAQGPLLEAERLAVQLKSRMIEAQSLLYQAERSALLGSGAEGQQLLARARGLLERYADRYCSTEADRLDALLRGEKFRISDGAFSITRSFLPPWREAHDALGRYLLGESLKLAGGSQVGAARILGVTKAYITMLRRKHGI
ncbi:MAG: tetratricopeptide repeat protein [Acidobacteria bacterium]|nr:tetratricopeptide repeat protein [Acidobacteriota bacterium]